MFRIPEPLPEWVPVKRAAAFLGVSERRVRYLAEKGQLAASRDRHRHLLIARRDLIERKRLQPLPVKPLGPRALRLVKDAMAPDYGEEVSSLWKHADSSSRSRAKERAARLREHETPAALIRAWSLHEPAPQQFWANQNQAQQLQRHATGFSHPAARLSAPAQLEVRVPREPDHLRVKRDPQSAPVLVLAHQDAHSERVRVMDAIFDLAGHGRDREDAAVERLVRP